MKGLKLDHLGTFVNVADLGSFSAAAERGGISQPAVSLQIRQLERQFGVRLVERVGRRAQPTPAGSALLASVRRIQEEVATAATAVASHRSGAVGSVRIGTGATACIYLLPPILRTLRQSAPGLEITVQTGDTADILRRLEDNAVDMALVTLPAPGRMFETTELCRDPLVAAFPAGETPRPPLAPAMLAGRPLILYQGGAHTRRIVDQWFAAAGQAPKPVMELGSVEAIKRLVGAGLGWSILPQMAIEATDPHPDVATAPLSPTLERMLGVVLRRDKRLGGGLRETLAAVREGAARRGHDT